jgi:hypothetical protein
MGELRIDAERQGVGGAIEYLGCQRVGRDLRLYAVLGDETFERYLEPNEAAAFPRLASRRGLPPTTSDALRKLARSGDDEQGWRWVTLEELLELDWARPIREQKFVGPVGFAAHASGARVRWFTEDSPATRERISRLGIEILSGDAMRQLLVADPEIVVRDPTESSARVCTLIDLERPLAEVLEMTESLAWLRAFSDASTVRVALAIGV